MHGHCNQPDLFAAEETRTCTRCGRDHPISDFSLYDNGRGPARRRVCRHCRNEYNAHLRHHGSPPDRDRLTEKRCTRCKTLKTIDGFPWNVNGSGKRRRASTCRTCKAALTRAWHARLGAEGRKARSRHKAYGITAEEYRRLRDAQGGACAICGDTDFGVDVRTGRNRDMDVDHCHKTGKVRGLLCQRCNNGLGCFGDDPKILHAAISYLARHQE